MFDDILKEGLSSDTSYLSQADWAEKHFLNPKYPHAVKDDPSGEYHAKLQITDADGNPLPHLKKDDELPLILRPYQRESMNVKRPRRVHRWGRRCIAPGTPVLMVDGSYAPIESIEPGDEVMTRNMNTGALESKPVHLQWDNGVKEVYRVRLRNGRSVVCTANHPFLKYGTFVWRSIEDGLQVGDALTVLSPENTWAASKVESITPLGKKQTYDIGVVDNHNFIADGVCVHNTGKTFQIGVEIVTEALRNPSAQILVLAPAQNQVKVIFDDYVRPLLRVYRNRRSGRIGVSDDTSELGKTTDFVITKDTQKPQEIIIRGTDGHKATIRGMVVSDSARGQTADFLILDEADYADTEKIQGIVTPIMMSSPMTRMLMVSTPSGQADTYFRNRFDDDDWWTSHQDFTVLPHYNQEMWDRMAKQAGGENTNTFKQEYLAQWGTAVEGVFDQQALSESFIITPYPLVMEEENPRTRERTPLAAADSTDLSSKKIAYYDGVRVRNNNVRHDPLGSVSTFKPDYRSDGVITIGTDWNDVAGMQTVIIWWPSKETLKSGRLKVARYPYNQGAPVVTRRDKNENGRARAYSVGQTNGDPGGPHDLSETRGIVIWHGRLERGTFNWQSAANRVASIMGISRFADVWYVDKGYGTQANSMIKKIMTVGEWEADMNLFSKAEEVDPQTLENIRAFDPERDPERTGKKYRPILFGNPYDHSDIDFSPGQGRYKDVMINLTKRMVVGRQLLFPHKELYGYHREEELGDHYKTSYSLKEGDTVEEKIPETDRDRLEANGSDPARGESGFGGLVTQMQTTKIDGYTPTGRPRYKGDWHAVDGLMLAVLAYWENYSEEGPGNMFRSDTRVRIKQEEDVFRAAGEATRKARRNREKARGNANFGNYRTKSYATERGPLKDLVEGRARPSEVGTTMGEMFDQAFG